MIRKMIKGFFCTTGAASFIGLVGIADADFSNPNFYIYFAFVIAVFAVSFLVLKMLED